MDEPRQPETGDDAMLTHAWVDDPAVEPTAPESPATAVALEEPDETPAPERDVEEASRALKIEVARMLAETRVVIDRVLETIAENRLQARLLVTQQLGIDTRPEILNTIVRIASNPSSNTIDRELPRHLLTAHSLIELESKRLLEDPELDADLIATGHLVLPELLLLARHIQDDIRAALDKLPEDERDFLLQVCNSFRTAEGKVATAITLGPRIELLVRLGATDGLRDEVPTLSDGEAAFVRELATTGTTEDSPGRACLNAVALRTLMVEDIETWRTLCSETADGEGNVAPPDELRQRMEREKSAFHYLSEEIQSKQDAALMAGLTAYADELRAYRQGLFATYLEFAPAQRGASTGKASVEVEDDSELSKLVEETLLADAAAEAARGQATSNEELYLEALTEMRKPESAKPARAVSPGAAARRAERRRVRLLIGASVALFAVCVALYAPRLLTPSRPEVSVDDFRGAATLTRGASAGGTMYSEISSAEWTALTRDQRFAKLEELGEIARAKGLRALFLADGSGRELGYWTLAHGAALTEATPTR